MQEEKKSQLYVTPMPHKAISWFLFRNFVGQKGVAWYTQSSERKKTCNPEYSIQQDHHVEQKERESISRQAKIKRTQQY